MPDGDVLSSVRLAPSEAISFFRQKLSVPTERWGELTSAAHAQSFAVAGATSEALLNDFKTAVGRAISDGKTLAEFRKDFDGIVKRRGWQHTGTPGWRAQLIYETNVSSAYAAGRYRRMTTPEALELYPYWRYAHHSCVHPRPLHVAWSGTILPNDDPWWASHYPPNGFHCHCTVELVSHNRLERNGWKVDEAPVVETRPWKNPATGKVERVPVGIDPGFQTNQGMEWARAQKERARVAMRPITHVDGKPVDEMPHDERIKIQQSQVRQLVTMTPRPVGTVEAGLLPETIQKMLGSHVREILLSAENVLKNKPHHPEITADDYALLPKLLSGPDYVIDDNDPVRLMLIAGEGTPYRIGIKRTRDGSANFVLSMVEIRDRALQQLLRNKPVIYRKYGKDE